MLINSNNKKVSIASLIFLIVCLTIPTTGFSVDTQNTLFLDQYNRYSVFHGVNVVRKLFPFYPELDHFDANNSLTDMDLQNLKGWGFNMIRLHVAWEGVEPQRGQYNYTYIQKLRDVVRKASKYDINVLLDAHQDLFNRKFCGEGFPDWTINRTNFPYPLKIDLQYDKDGMPNRQKCLSIQFALFYTTQDLMRFQQDFFTNKHGLLDSFAKMWQQVAAYMSRQPNLLGYEIVNEPIGANFYKNPADTLLPGVSNNKYLLPAYDKIYQAIRKIDPSNLVFFQPSVIDALGGGFYGTLGDQKQKQRQVFSYHVYCPYVTPLGQPVSTKFCQVFDQLQVASKQLNAQFMKVGAFMTEYGALSNSPKSAKQVTILTDLMSQYFRSWSYWQFKYMDDITTAARPGTTQSFYDQHGNLQQNKVKALARPYARAICGKPISQTFKNGVYKLIWVPDRECFNKNTEIYISPFYYDPTFFSYTFKNCDNCSLSLLPKQTQYYQILIDKHHNRRIELIVTSKK